MISRTAICPIALLLLLGATPRQYDSQYVLQRYALALASLALPKAVIFSYTISQAGPSNIEQRHRIYRSGTAVRDETLSIDGIQLGRKIVRFTHRPDRYTVERFAPRTDAYELLFLGSIKDGHHADYVFEATPLNRSSSAWIDRVTIDGVKFLPRAVHFHSSGFGASGTGDIEFAPLGRYWMPIVSDAQARVRGKPARERIIWSDYRFPDSLPRSTFQPPEPLPQPTPTP
ncbi:MAG: hypothetical protein JOZ77_06530 [Candidatus Eremiobacteraeota bacterium]|nr:hypothetical protein [Candidatus Eremiobacteraeota bacterium]